MRPTIASNTERPCLDVPIVLTVDLQAKWDSENGWVKENCVEVKFDAPLYEPLNGQNFV